ncbi:MAG: hypothetical protein ACR5K3_05590 [Wolbachia sp.]
MNKQIFLDSSVEHWNDKRGGTGTTGGGHFHDTIIKEPVSATWIIGD